MSSVSGRLCLKLRVKGFQKKSNSQRKVWQLYEGSSEQTSVGRILAALPPAPGQFVWVKQSSLSVCCSPRPLLLWANRKPQSATPGFLFSAGQQVPLSVSMEILVSGCHRLLPWKLRSVGVAHCCHGNTGQWVFSCLETGSRASCCFCVLWENQAAVTALKMTSFCFSSLPVGSRAPVAAVLINDNEVRINTSHLRLL